MLPTIREMQLILKDSVSVPVRTVELKTITQEHVNEIDTYSSALVQNRERLLRANFLINRSKRSFAI